MALLPGPDDYASACGRRLNGPKATDPQTQADYDEYCKLYRDFVNKRAPFFRKPEWIPHPATGRVEGWEKLVLNDPLYAASMQHIRGDIQNEYRNLFQDLVAAIEKLSNCNYVHSWGRKTRIIALYDYQNSGGMDVVHDISNARNWMFPVCGVQTTTYFDTPGEGYVPETAEIKGPDPVPVVFRAEYEPSPLQHYGIPREMCLSISKHPDTVFEYSALLWSTIKGQ